MSERKSTSNETQTPDATGEHDAIQVVAKCDTFRRAGFVFTRNATTLPLAELSQQQLAQLCQEPMLVVQAIRLDAEG